MATGVLVLFIGKSTKQVQFHESASKTYIAGLKLGYATNTYDITGEVTSRHDGFTGVPRERLEQALEKLRGNIMQMPPIYSAIKVKGRKLYEYARRGQDIELKPRPVTINRLDIISGEGADWNLLIDCSKGTYIRSLCHDIGAELGIGGVMSGLIRTRSGEFTLEQCHTLEEIIYDAKDGNCSWIL
jgi:tRNA pseudouridine55 synthase